MFGSSKNLLCVFGSSKNCFVFLDLQKMCFVGLDLQKLCFVDAVSLMTLRAHASAHSSAEVVLLETV